MFSRSTPTTSPFGLTRLLLRYIIHDPEAGKDKGMESKGRGGGEEKCTLTHFADTGSGVLTSFLRSVPFYFLLILPCSPYGFFSLSGAFILKLLPIHAIVC
jgi:hypothetical protein